MMIESLFVDNPLIVKHIRSRLRRKDLLTPLVMVVIISLFVTWLGNEYEGLAALFTLFVLQGLLLFIGGTAQVANAVAQARDSGILDFHRISPQPPLSMSIGFLLGAPAREWVLSAAIVPFELLLLPRSHLKPECLALVLFSLVVCAVLYHLLGLAVGLIASRPRVAASVNVLVVLVNFTCLAGPIGYLTVAPAWVLAIKWSDIFMHRDFRMFWDLAERHFVMAMVHQVVLISFLLIGAVREIRQERAYFCSKPGGLAFLAIFSGLLVVDLESFGAKAEWGAWAFVYATTVGAMVLAAVLAPDARDFAKGVRRAARAHLRQVPFWTDTSSNWAPLAGGAALVGGGCLMLAANAQFEGTTWTGYTRAVIIALASLVAFGCARQGFELRFGKQHSKSYFNLLVFVVWFVPLLLAMVIGKGSASSDTLATLVSICPWIGMGAVGAGTAAAPVIVGIHTVMAVYAAWWRWSAEQAATAGALAQVPR